MPQHNIRSDRPDIWFTILPINGAVAYNPVLTHARVLMGLIEGLVFGYHDRSPYVGFYESHIEMILSGKSRGKISITKSQLLLSDIESSNSTLNVTKTTAIYGTFTARKPIADLE